MAFGRERTYGVNRVCVYGVGDMLIWGEVGARYIIRQNKEEEIKSNY